MPNTTYEIVPLTDEPDAYTWSSPEGADYYTVYARGEDGRAMAKVDVPSQEAAWAYVELDTETEPPHALVWLGASFVELSRPAWMAGTRL